MLRQLNITHLQERAKVSFELCHSDEVAWNELKTFFSKEYNATIPECGIKQVFLNILKTLRQQ